MQGSGTLYVMAYRIWVPNTSNYNGHIIDSITFYMYWIYKTLCWMQDTWLVNLVKQKKENFQETTSYKPARTLGLRTRNSYIKQACKEFGGHNKKQRHQTSLQGHWRWEQEITTLYKFTRILGGQNKKQLHHTSFQGHWGWEKEITTLYKFTRILGVRTRNNYTIQACKDIAVQTRTSEEKCWVLGTMKGRDQMISTPTLELTSLMLNYFTARTAVL